MADDKKYYYLKLKEGFFDSEDMKLLQAMKDGYLYSDILLKLYLQSLRQEGRLMYRGIIPYTPDMISSITHHQVGTIEKAMKILEQMGFIEILDNGAIYMLDIQNFIGQSSTEADRQRAYRKEINAEKTRILGKINVTYDVTNVTTDDVTNVTANDQRMYEKRTPENRDKRLESKDKNNINTFAQGSGKQAPEPEAEVEAVILNDGSEWRPTQALFAEYVRLYPNVDVKQQFSKMRGWCISNPGHRKTKKGVKRFVNSWLAREQDKGYRKPVNNTAYGPHGRAEAEGSGYGKGLFERLENENPGNHEAGEKREKPDG